MNFSEKPIIGMIHLSSEFPLKRAIYEIELLAQEGVEACLIENYHGSTQDVIDLLRHYTDNARPKIEFGVNILPNNFQEAFELAALFNCSFIQMDVITGKYQRTTSVDIETYTKYRETFPEIQVLGGVFPKYYTPVDASIEALTDYLKEARLLCDAVVVTGSGTGKETPLDKIKTFRSILGDFPLIIGAGLDVDNAIEQMEYADGGIVGSAFKPSKATTARILEPLVKEFMEKLRK